MINAVLASWVLFLLPAPAGTLRLADSGRVYARSAQRDSATALQLENTPQLETGLAWPTWTLGLVYEPRLVWMDVLGADASPTLLLHSAVLSAALQRPRYTLSFVQSVALGSQDFRPGLSMSSSGGIDAAPSASPTATPDVPEPLLLPRAQVIRVVDENTAAELRYLWSRRWSSEFQAALGSSGGADATARQFLPRQRKALLGASLAFSRTRRDQLGTDLNGDQIHTSNGYDHWLGTAIERWSMRWTEHCASELGAGATLADTTAPDGSRSSRWVPVGSASVSQALLARDVRVGLDFRVGHDSDINSLLGTLQTRVHGAAQATLTAEPTSLLLRVSAAQTVATAAPDSVRIVSADLGVNRELREWLDLQLGAEVTWQRFVGAGSFSAPSSAWLLYVGLVGHAKEQRF